MSDKNLLSYLHVLGLKSDTCLIKKIFVTGMWACALSFFFEPYLYLMFESSQPRHPRGCPFWQVGC